MIGGKPYLLGHTMDYVKVALPLSKGTEHPRSGELVPMVLQEFLTEEILLGHEATLF